MVQNVYPIGNRNHGIQKVVGGISYYFARSSGLDRSSSFLTSLVVSKIFENFLGLNICYTYTAKNVFVASMIAETIFSNTRARSVSMPHENNVFGTNLTEL